VKDQHKLWAATQLPKGIRVNLQHELYTWLEASSQEKSFDFQVETVYKDILSCEQDAHSVVVVSALTRINILVLPDIAGAKCCSPGQTSRSQDFP